MQEMVKKALMPEKKTLKCRPLESSAEDVLGQEHEGLSCFLRTQNWLQALLPLASISHFGFSVWRSGGLCPNVNFLQPQGVQCFSEMLCKVKAQLIPRELVEQGQQHILLEAANDWAAKYFTFLMDTNPDSKMQWKPGTEVTQQKTFASGNSSE